jgi:hypothetical protein
MYVYLYIYIFTSVVSNAVYMLAFLGTVFSWLGFLTCLAFELLVFWTYFHTYKSVYIFQGCMTKTSWSIFIYINSITDCVWPKMVATCFVLNGWWTSGSLTRAGIRSLDHPTSTLISIPTTLCRMPVYLRNKKNYILRDRNLITC